MHNEFKRQSPYRGFGVILFFLIFVPAVLYWLIGALLAEYSRFSAALDHATAKALGCGFGFLFHLICLMSGVMTDGWQAVKYRMGEFCENLVVGVRYAFTTYLEDMRDDGVTFLIYLIIIVINLAVTADGILDALALL